MSYPTLFTTPGVRAFAEEIDAERQRQIVKFGEQHHPDVEPRDIPIVRHHYYASRADIWKQVNAERATPSTGGRCAACPGSASGPHTHTAWDGVLLEEVYEALAESDPVRLRAELVQVAAVCAAWIADIDSRKAPVPRCDVEFESGARCSKSAGHWTPENQDPHTPGTTAAEEQPAACGKCRVLFDPADTRFDGRAQHRDTPYCRGCVDRCHDNESADHRCVICA